MYIINGTYDAYNLSTSEKTYNQYGSNSAFDVQSFQESKEACMENISNEITKLFGSFDESRLKVNDGYEVQFYNSVDCLADF